MRRAGNYFLWLCAIAVIAPQQISAATIPATAVTHVADVAPLIVTAYQATAQSQTIAKTTTYKLDQIDILELYNNGDSLIDLSQWHIFDANELDGSPRELHFSSSHAGYLAPHQHVVLASKDTVENATYQLDGWSREATTYASIVGLRIENDEFRAGKIELKNANGKLQKRTIGVESYLDTFVEAVPIGTPHVDPYLTAQLFDDGLYQAAPEPNGLQIVEIYPYARDCVPYDETTECRDYVKIFNTGSQSITLDGYVLRTSSSSTSRTSSNTIQLFGDLAPGQYKTISYTDADEPLSLTNSGGYLWFEDTYGVGTYHAGLVSYPSASSTRQGMSYMLDTTGNWQWTTTPQPNGANILTVQAEAVTTCPEGKYLNPDTNRCRSIADVVNALAACQEGYERNPTTNRCRKIASASTTSTLTPCKEGQERNPLTNRCRSIASAVAELLPCDEGYERNPATNRCRKVTSSSVPKASYPVQPYQQSAQQTLLSWIIGGGIGAMVLGYAGWEWRREIAGFGRRIVTRIRR